jgi:SET domain-containing protein
MTQKIPGKIITYVDNSSIHGKGLFATELIPKDTVIGHLEGEHTTQDGIYVLWLDQDNGLEVCCDLKYINHSDTPNACYYDDKSVVALHDIMAGEEITHNYEADW